MNNWLGTIAIIAAIVAALIGFGVGYASYADESKGGAVALGFLGAIIGAIIGAVGSVIVVGIVVTLFILWVFAMWLSEQ